MQLNLSKPQENLIPATEAAARLGISERTLYKRIEKGEYKAHKENHKTYLIMADNKQEAYNSEIAFLKLQEAFQEVVKKNKELEDANHKINEQDKTIEALRNELNFMRSLMAGFGRQSHDQKHNSAPIPPWQYGGQPYC